MNSSFYQYGRWLGLTFVLGFFLPLFQPAFGRASIVDYTDSSLSVDDMIVQYHGNVNTITNEFIDRLINSDDPNVLYPPSDSSCDSDNVSTFCLAQKLNDELTAFEFGLISHKDQIPEEISIDTAPSNLNTAFQKASEQNNVLQEQRQYAQDALDLTLAVYNQIQVVYPMHTEMLRLITNLKTYRDNLASLRDVIELYPNKFNGATTAQCQ